MEIIDNFIPDDEFAKLQEVLLGSDFPWYYNPYIATTDKNEHGFQFTHALFRDNGESSNALPVVFPVLDRIEPKTLYRAKLNLGGRTASPEQGGWHVDYNPEQLKCITAVYYLNTNNGYTLFEDGTRVDSVANRLAFFDSSLSHTSVTQTDEKVRCVLNLNYNF
jgi:hypothetical protein